MKRVLLTCLALVTFAAARPSLQVDRERIEAGQTFGLQFIVPLQELPDNREVLQIETKNGFTFQGLDSTDQLIRPDMFESFFGGGRAYKARIYTLKIRAPKRTGQLDVGQIFWTINGERQAVSGSIPVNVQRSYNDDALAVSLTPSKKSIYEGEQFYVTLGFHTFEHFEGNLQATDMNTGSDFIVHRSDLSNMEFKPVDGARREMQASAKFAWLSPTKSGNLQIPAFKFKYTKRGEPKIVEEKKQMGNMSFSSRSVKQESVETEAATPVVNINVKPLPAEGRPANFSGMVGSYSFDAQFDKDHLKVGEALTLSITIKGDGTPGTITDPKLPRFDDFRSVPPENSIDKKIVGSKVVTTKSIKIFLYPKKKGSFEIPEISYSWFDPAKKAYQSETLGPWTIEVEKGDASAEAAFMPAATHPTAVQKQEIEALGSDIRFIHKVSGKKESPTPHRDILFWVVFLAAIPFYLVAAGMIRRHRKHSSDAALVRKSKAKKMLKGRFFDAHTAMQKGDVKAFYAALEAGLIDYLSDITNLEFKGMTRNQMRQELEQLGLDADNIDAIDKWLEKCSFARFAPVSPSPEEQDSMLKDMEKLCDGLGILK